MMHDGCRWKILSVAYDSEYARVMAYYYDMNGDDASNPTMKICEYTPCGELCKIMGLDRDDDDSDDGSDNGGRSAAKRGKQAAAKKKKTKKSKGKGKDKSKPKAKRNSRGMVKMISGAPTSEKLTFKWKKVGNPVKYTSKKGYKTAALEWTGEHKRFRPGPLHCKLKSTDEPLKWFLLSYTEECNKADAKHSNAYIRYCREKGIKHYGEVKDGDYTFKMAAHLACAYLLNGLSPVPSHDHFHKKSFAFKGHRIADLFSQRELKIAKAFFHCSGSYDKVRIMSHICAPHVIVI